MCLGGLRVAGVMGREGGVGPSLARDWRRAAAGLSEGSSICSLFFRGMMEGGFLDALFNHSLQ